MEDQKNKTDQAIQLEILEFGGEGRDSAGEERLEGNGEEETREKDWALGFILPDLRLFGRVL